MVYVDLLQFHLHLYCKAFIFEMKWNPNKWKLINLKRLPVFLVPVVKVHVRLEAVDPLSLLCRRIEFEIEISLCSNSASPPSNTRNRHVHNNGFEYSREQCTGAEPNKTSWSERNPSAAGIRAREVLLADRCFQSPCRRSPRYHAQVLSSFCSVPYRWMLRCLWCSWGRCLGLRLWAPRSSKRDWWGPTVKMDLENIVAGESMLSAVDIWWGYAPRRPGTYM